MRVDLKLAIVKSGETQRSLARKLGWPESKLSNIVCDVRAVNRQERAQLCQILGVDEAEIFPEVRDLAVA